MAGKRKIEKVIHKDGTVSYKTKVELLPWSDGKRRQTTLTARKYKELEDKIREHEQAMAEGRKAPSEQKKRLGEYCNEYMAAISGRRLNTRMNFQQALRVFQKYLGVNTLLTDLNAGKIEEATREMKKIGHLADITVYNHYQRFHQVIKNAVEKDYIPKDPCIGVLITKPERPEKEIWDEEQVKRLDRYLKSCIMRYVVLFVLLLRTGARIGEILALRWMDVDFENKLMSITRTALVNGEYGPPKSKRGYRNVPLDKGTLNMLSKHKVRQNREKLLHGKEDWNPENLVFCKQNGSRLPYREALESWIRIAYHAGLPYLPMHRLRHYHITMLLKAGLPASSVAERVGDTTATIEKDYTHVLQSMREAVVKVIEQEFEELP